MATKFTRKLISGIDFNPPVTRNKIKVAVQKLEKIINELEEKLALLEVNDQNEETIIELKRKIGIKWLALAIFTKDSEH